MTAVLTQYCALDAEARQSYDAFNHTLHGAVGNAVSRELGALSKNAAAAYFTALREPVSRTAWTAFVQAVSDFLDELDAGIGISVDPSAGTSRRQLRDIVRENDDLIRSAAPVVPTVRDFHEALKAEAS